MGKYSILKRERLTAEPFFFRNLIVLSMSAFFELISEQKYENSKWHLICYLPLTLTPKQNIF
jgi:hypothetical protein